MNRRMLMVTMLLFSSANNVKALPAFLDKLGGGVTIAVDCANWPVSKLSNLKDVPLFNHLLNPDTSKLGERVRWSKLAITVALTFAIYKQPTVNTTIKKIRAAIFGEKEVKEDEEDAEKKE